MMKKLKSLSVWLLAAAAAVLTPSAIAETELELGALGLISDYRSVDVSGPGGASGQAGPGLGFSGGFVLGQNMSNRWGGEFRYLYFRNDLELSSGGQEASLLRRQLLELTSNAQHGGRVAGIFLRASAQTQDLSQ